MRVFYIKKNKGMSAMRAPIEIPLSKYNLGFNEYSEGGSEFFITILTWNLFFKLPLNCILLFIMWRSWHFMLFLFFFWYLSVKGIKGLISKGSRKKYKSSFFLGVRPLSPYFSSPLSLELSGHIFRGDLIVFFLERQYNLFS